MGKSGKIAGSWWFIEEILNGMRRFGAALGILENCSAWVFLIEEISGFGVGWKSPGRGSGRGQDAFSSC